MCEQTEINYLDGDVVWVKLGSYWWPGQVVGVEKLPEDIQAEFRKKPLIAAVKFFQEDSFEFVKNYQQIYKYNCTQKEDFIKKGLDKYRTKSKDGSNYMNKFPEDVKTAETLTNGDPDILLSEKFSPEEKPDISGLFGEKKIPKKKRNRDEFFKKNETDIRRRITHPRFLQESDHEVRIRQQPMNLPSTSSGTSPGGIYPCHICGFTATRVNVIICHLKNHRLNNETELTIKLKVKNNIQSKPRQTHSDTPKRKYVRKSVPNKNKSESGIESGKRKHSKQIEKPNKKKKSDPELREKLLADWNVESDEDESSEFGKSIENSSADISTKNQSSIESTDDNDILKDELSKDNTDNFEFLQESEKLLQETDNFAKLSMLKDISSNFEKSDLEESSLEKSEVSSSPKRSKENLHCKKTIIDKEKDDRKLRLSCFDFDEEDVPEPSISSVRKIPRSLGNKNMSIKKEIIKEFEMSQALKNDLGKDSKNELSQANLQTNIQTGMIEEKVQINENTDKIIQNEKIKKSKNNVRDKNFEKISEICETQVEIVEIFEVEKEEDKDVKKLENQILKPDNENNIVITEIKCDVAKEKIENDNTVINVNKQSKEDEFLKEEIKNDNTVKINSKNINDDSEKSEKESVEKVKIQEENQTKEKNLDQSIKNKQHTTEEKNENKNQPTNESVEDTMPEKEIANVNSPDFLKDDFSLNEAKKIFQVEDNEKIVSSESPAQEKENEIENKTTLLPVDSIFDAQNNFDTANLSNSKTNLQVSKNEDNSTENEDNLNSIVKKRRGRPRKNLENTEVASDNEYSKIEFDQKASESDTDLSYTGRKRKPNRKYESSLYIQSFEHRSTKTDESLSETDDKPEQTKSKLKRGKKSTIQLSDQDKNLKSSSNHLEDSDVNDININITKNRLESEEIKIEQDNSLESLNASKQSDCNKLKEENNLLENEANEIQQSNDTETLPPKKSQIKKFELSQIDSVENNVKNFCVDLDDQLPKIFEEKKSNLEENLTDESKHEQNETSLEVPETTKIMQDFNEETNKETNKEEKIKYSQDVAEKVVIDNSALKSPLNIIESHNESVIDNSEKSELLTTSKVSEKSEPLTTSKVSEKSEPLTTSKVSEKSEPLTTSKVSEKSEQLTSSKVKKGKFEDNQYDSFQDAFVKTLKNENSLIVKNIDDTKNLEVKDFESHSTKNVSSIETNNSQNLTQESIISNFSIGENFDNIEVVVAQNSEMEIKTGEEVSVSNVKGIIPTSNDNAINIQSNNIVEEEKNSINLNENLKNLDESTSTAASPLTQDVKMSVPVKKREKPRIIENVALKEPMILKTKLMEKATGKVGKHKLDNDSLKSDEPKTFPKTKVMKMETVIANSKNRLQTLSSNQNLSMAKKVIKPVKSEDGSLVSPIKDVRKEQIISALPQTIKEVPCNEKYIQQSSQSLVDMDLDINSMSFVLSEDVLTPESIEQMPVVISSVLPPTNSIVTTLAKTLQTTSVTQTKQISSNQSFESSKELHEISSKKKSGTPTILKNKSKAKPTITSIKTIVPPLTSAGYKGGYKVNTHALKTSLSNQKTSGKYVIVQTSGSQQAYSTHQKVAIPTSKGSGNAQIVQQGGKVVILTSPQSGQPGQKVFPLNSLSKTLNSGKVQRIITTKQGQQVFTSVSPQSYVGSKTILASKNTDVGISPTTSKVIGQKLIGQQQIITSKSVLTQLPGTLTKSTVLGTVPQGILTKDGVFTPINASTLGGKTIISSKTLVAKGFPSQTITTSKNFIAPLSQSFSGKTIISPQGIVSKGAVLTPITGSQVKALAAKKGNKLQNQQVQRKIQVTGTQKSPKVPISPQSAKNATSFKTSSNVVVLQNTELKTVTPNKKTVKQTVQKQVPAATVLSSTTVTTMQQKNKVPSTSLEHKIINPKNVNKSIKLQQKIVTEKSEENSQFKPLVSNEASLSVNTKTVEQRQIGSLVTKTSKSTNKNLQKRISNVTNVTNSTVLSPSNLSASLSVTAPSVESISHDKIPKKEDFPEQVTLQEETMASNVQRIGVNEAEKTEVPKPTTQAQIMALPTENSDGTQTYVLVTVDEQGHIIPLDNNTLMSLDGTSNFDGSRTLYIDSSSLGETGTMDNIVLQIDNSSLTNLQAAAVPESVQAVTETLPTSEITQTTNQDILAAALANTDFQHEIGVVETTSSTAMTSLTQTSLINQTILQSTIIPPTEPISSPLVLETSLTLNQPIMTPLEVPSSLSIQSETTPATVATTMPSSLELPIVATNQNITFTATEESLLPIPGNSMPEIEDNVEASMQKTVDIKIPSSTQNTLDTTTNLVENTSDKPNETESKPIENISYSITISENNFDKKQIQATPSMPIIDDSFNANSGFDSTNASVVVEDNLRNFVAKTSEELIQDLTGSDSLQESNETLCTENVTNEKSCSSIQEVTSETPQIILSDTQDDCVSSQQCMIPAIAESQNKIMPENVENSNEINKEALHILNPINEEVSTVSSETPTEVQSSHEIQVFDTEDKGIETALAVTDSTVNQERQPLTSSEEAISCDQQSETISTDVKSSKMVVDEENLENSKSEEESASMCHTSDLSSQGESSQVVEEKCKINFEDRISDTSQEAPSQSYEQFVSATSDVAEVPSQSAKSESSREAAQSLLYEPMETDDSVLSGEPPTQSYEDTKQNEASQSYKTLSEISTNAPTQSFNEIMEINDERVCMDESMDGPNFPTQSYEVEKIENSVENMETDTEISQEGNIPSQSNDVGADGIGTSSVSTNNSGLNEDETASSSYVPETPENQERDQDQESAISTSSYEIPPCEELNIASSSVIPDTSVQSEHSSIHNNGVPEIPTSSYNLNPDSSSTHVDSVPTSSYEDQIIVEQNVSTSYQVPISMANFEEVASQNYVTDSSDERNEPTSYYPHHQEVTESYYESMCKQSNSRLEANSEEEATPSYYENNPTDVTSEASQSYFNQEEATPSYSNHDISPSYYNPRAEAEASQSYYSSHELNRSTTQSALQNVEATQSFYQENSDEQRLRQQGEATPTDYADRYSVDYVPVSSPLDRHDLVESSVPARSMDR